MGVVVVVVGLAMRYWMLRNPLGRVDSDEATTGLMARNILHGNFAAIVSGNNYGGTLEAFIYAPIYWVVGPNPWVLKTLAILEWLCVALVLAKLASKLFGRATGVAVGLVVWAGGPWMLFLSTRLFMGYPSGVLCLGAFTYCAIELARVPDLSSIRSRRLAGICGVAAGLAVWQHPLAMASVLTGIVGLAIDLRQGDLKIKTRLFARWCGGALVGVFPFLWYNATNSWPSKNLPDIQQTTLISRVHSMYTQLIPRALGLRDFSGRWTFGRPTIVLFIVLVIGVLVGAARLLPTHASIGLGGIFGPSIMALFPSLYFVIDAHYFPFVMIPVLLCLAAAVPRNLNWDVLRPVLISALAIFLAASTMLNGWRNFDHHLADPNAEIFALERGLKGESFHYIRADYWIAYRTAFLTNNRIVAASSVPTRFPPMDAEANASSRLAFVTYVGDSADITWQATLKMRRMVIGKFAVFFPIAAP